MPRKISYVLSAIVALMIGVVAFASPASAASRAFTLGSGENTVALVTLEYDYVAGTSNTHYSVKASNARHVHVWNPSGNDHGRIYVLVKTPTGSSHTCGTDNAEYLGQVLDTVTVGTSCSINDSPTNNYVKVEIESIGESGGSLGKWCVNIRPTAASAAGGACP